MNAKVAVPKKLDAHVQRQSDIKVYDAFSGLRDQILLHIETIYAFDLRCRIITDLKRGQAYDICVGAGMYVQDRMYEENQRHAEQAEAG